MSNIIFYLKTHRTLILIIFLIFLLISALVLRFDTPTNLLHRLPIPSVTQITTSDFSLATVTNDAKDLIIPTIMDVYQVQNLTYSIDTLASEFQLTQKQNDNLWTDQSNTKSLVFDKYQHRFTFTDSSFSGDFDVATAQSINVNTEIEVAKNFVTNFLQVTTLVPDTKNIVYSNKSDTEAQYNAHGLSAIPSGANVVNIPFILSFNFYPVFSEADTSPLIVVSVDSSGKVIQAAFSQHLFNLGKTIKAATQPLSSAIKTIPRNSGIVIKITSGDPNGFVLKNIQSLHVVSSTIEYRYFTSEKLIFPMYRVIGDATLHGLSDPSQIEILLPIIPVESP